MNKSDLTYNIFNGFLQSLGIASQRPADSSPSQHQTIYKTVRLLFPQ